MMFDMNVRVAFGTANGRAGDGLLQSRRRGAHWLFRSSFAYSAWEPTPTTPLSSLPSLPFVECDFSVLLAGNSRLPGLLRLSYFGPHL